MKKKTINYITAFSLLVLAVVGVAWFFGFTPQQSVQEQPSQSGAGVSAYVPFQLYEVNLQLRDYYDKVAVPTDGSFVGKVYEKGVSPEQMRDPRTPYVEVLSPANDFATSGVLTATKTKILTGNEYKVLVVDENGNYYASIYNMKVPELEATQDTYTFGPEYVKRIGNLVGVESVEENSTGVDVQISNGNAIATIDLNNAPDNPYFTIKFAFENNVAKSVVEDVVIRAVNDAQNPMDEDAIDSVKFSLDKGDSLNIDSDATSLIRAGQTIKVGDIEDGDRSVYEITIRLDKALLESGETMYIYFDDLGDYLGEDANGDTGMTPKYIKIQVA